MPEELRPQIAIELENFDRLRSEMEGLLVLKEEREFIRVRTAGSIIHDLYCGIEKIFEKIAVGVDKNLPEGEDWHRELLLQMAKPLVGLRNGVISEELMRELKEFLRFRHLFRHIYGFELKWERIEPLCLRMESVVEKLKEEINRFLAEIEP